MISDSPHRARAGRAAHAPVAGSSDVAAYIADIAGELSALAAEANLGLLAYFLDMARIESELEARRDIDRPPALGR